MSKRDQRADVIDELRALHATHNYERAVFNKLVAVLHASRGGGRAAFLYGPPGVGKSTIAKLALNQFVSETGRNPWVMVNSAPSGGGAFNFAMVCRQLLAAAGRSPELIDRVRLPPFAATTRHELVVAVQRDLMIRQPGAAAIDEIERWVGSDRQEVGHLESVTWWVDETKVPFLIIGTNDAMDATIRSAKLSRRLSPVYYGPYALDNVEARNLYLGAFKKFVAFLTANDLLDPAFALASLGDEVMRLTLGRVGMMRDLIVMAAEIAAREDHGIAASDFELAAELVTSEEARKKLRADHAQGEAMLRAMRGAEMRPPDAAVEASVERKAEIPAPRSVGNKKKKGGSVQRKPKVHPVGAGYS